MPAFFARPAGSLCASAAGPAILLVFLTGLAACASPEASITFGTGNLEVMVRSADFALPEELRDGMSVRSAPCGPMGACPSAERVVVTCDSGVCDPQPTTVELPLGAVVDFDEASAELESFFTEVTSVRVTSATYEVQSNTLTLDLAPMEVYWGPEGATAVGSPGVTHLGTVPPIAGGSIGSGEVALDAGGSAALSDYLVHTARRVRFFAQTTVDLEPGGPFPAGDLRVAVAMVVRAEGKVID